MSDFDSLREDIAAIGKAVDGYSATAVHHLLEQSTQIDRLWADNAELRDELHAVANRVEALTRARLTEPAEVAERMIVPSAVQPVCICGHRYDHHRHHGQTGCYSANCLCKGYRPRGAKLANG